MSSKTVSSSSESGIVADILLAAKRGSAMSSVEEVEAITGRGLVGDRHFVAEGDARDNNVTLIELENINRFCEATGLDFSPEDSRRNIVTSGISLNPFVGREFSVGSVRLKALELCEPCASLARRTHRAVLWGLVGKGGLRCRIVSGGTIRRGDAIQVD